VVAPPYGGNHSCKIELNEEKLDLSWINDQWWKLLTEYTNRKDHPEKIERRNFEACVLIISDNV